MRNRIFLFSLIFLCLSCRQAEEYPIPVEKALVEAGKNAVELEKVLLHYRESEADSLKYKAACFLIEHMPAHYAYQGAALDSFYRAMHLVFLPPGNRSEEAERSYQARYDSVLERWGNDIITTSRIVRDIESIQAKYLIRNIEEAFQVWQKPWNRQISFDNFCRNILPYRIGNEPLSDWRSLYRKRRESYLKPQPTRPNPTYLFGVCQSLIRDYTDNLYEASELLPEFPLDRLIDIKSGSCREFAHLATAYGRAFGLPVAVDFSPFWGNRSMGHEWNVLLPQENTPLPFGVNGTLGTQSYDMREDVVAKIYRKTYAMNPKSLYARAGTETIPSLFRTPCMEDVTGQYADTVSLHVAVFPDSIYNKARFVYACVFDNQNWQIVQWGERTADSAVFRAMGKGCVYLPVYYGGDTLPNRPAGYPIICRLSGNTVLEPDKKHLQRIRLLRKYRYSNVLEDCAGYLTGGYFQAANRPDFRDAVLLDSIRHRPDNRFMPIDASGKGAYRYFRYVSAPKMHCNLNEIVLYDEHGQCLKPDRIFSSDEGMDGTEARMLFDGDVLNTFMTKDKNGWVAVGFRKPVSLSRLYYLPRNDDNFIREGEEYELFYWDKFGWCSLGKQIGTIDGILEYNNAPKNALFLLHNHTKGKEERIFTYENNQQVWW